MKNPRRFPRRAIIALLGTLAIGAAALASTAAKAANWPPPGKPMRVEVSRDTWVSAAGGEADFNTGGSSQLKTKGIVEFSILDFDPAPLKGQVITGATLHLHVLSPDIQRRLTVSTLATDWVEGTASSYKVQPGSASFHWAKQDQAAWAFPGSDLTAAFGGVGNTIWRFADPTAPDADGYQVVAVDPAVIAARVAGLSKGFVLFDDVGSEYVRKGKGIVYTHYPNRFISSREDHKHPPFWTIYVNGELPAEPKSMVVTDLKQVAPKQPLPAGEALVSWDVGKVALGFFVRYAEGGKLDWDKATPVPQYLVPMASSGQPGSGPQRLATLHLRDLSLKPGSEVTLGVQGVDRAGNLGPVATTTVKIPELAPVVLPPLAVKPFNDAGDLPSAGDAHIAIIDALDKVNPISGEMIPKHPDAYLKANHLWSAAKKTIRLYAAKNEIANFQVLVSGKSAGVSASLKFNDAAGGHAVLNMGGMQMTGTSKMNDANVPTAKFYRLRNVIPANGGSILPDPLEPLQKFEDDPALANKPKVPQPPLPALPASDEKIPGQTNMALLAEVYVPHTAAAGVHHGTLTIDSDGKQLTLDVELTVWDFTLPDHLSFVPEMGCYGLPPGQEVEYYRLAHYNRLNLNRLNYHWNGSVDAGWAPVWQNGKFDWTTFDSHAASLLDGSAFNDLPRKGVPVDFMYLALNENWPIPIDPNFKGGYWPEEALTPEYRQGFIKAAAMMAQHFKDKSWNKTKMEFYLNDKVYYKADDWNKCSAPWCLDEPADTQDFWALRWYGTTFHEGIDAICAHPEQGDPHFIFRCDISRPQWQRDILDGVVDLDTVGGDTFRRYNRQVMDRKQKLGDIIVPYGGSNDIAASNIQPAAWCLETWLLGGDGVEPWQTIGNSKSWHGDKSSEAMFYPGKDIGVEGPLGSIRLKSYLAGQQLTEYLTMLGQTLHQPRWAIAAAVRDGLQISGTSHKTSEADAGLVSYNTDPAALWELHTRVGQMLDAAKPAPRDPLIDLNAPVRDMKTIPDLGYVTVAPEH